VRIRRGALIVVLALGLLAMRLRQTQRAAEELHITPNRVDVRQPEDFGNHEDPEPSRPHCWPAPIGHSLTDAIAPRRQAAR